jgi:hypothetical protein
MIADAIARVRATWPRALRAPAGAAETLGACLAAHAPGVAAVLADAGVADPGEELLAWVDYAVGALAAPALLPGLAAAVEAFGREHADLGVRPHHVAAARTALDQALAALLGAAYDAPTRAAWAAGYAALAGALCRGACPAPAAPGAAPRAAARRPGAPRPAARRRTAGRRAAGRRAA